MSYETCSGNRSIKFSPVIQTPHTIGVVGSRSLGYEQAEWVSQVVDYLLGRGNHLATGGAMGMDEYVFFRLLRTGYSDHCTVFAAWRGYDGFPSKVRASIRQFKDYGGRIVRGPAVKNEPLIKTALLMRNIRLEELKQHGCVSGMVSERIYTHDCLKFYALFEDNVWDIVTDFLDTTGETLGQFIDGLRPEITDIDTLKTVLSWFAVEETAARILERFSETAHD